MKGENITMNSNKKTKNKKVNEAISNMGNTATFDALNNANNKSKDKKGSVQGLK
jgi:hypothetical protein